MVAGLTIGQNEGGQGGGDLNDPNNVIYPGWHHRQRLEGRVPPLGQLPAAVRHPLAGSMVANDGYPYVSTYNMTRAQARHPGRHAHARESDASTSASVATSAIRG